MKKEYKKFFRITGIIVAILIIYFIGYLVGHRNLVFEEGYKPKILNMNLGKPEDVDFSMFWNAWDVVKEKYYGKTDDQKMLYGAISGAINSLDDPYSLFMDPSESKRFLDDMNGSFDGIGAQIESKDGLVVVVAPLPESPAEKAGLKAQDIILKIDNEETKDMGFYEAIDKIRGKKGTKVKLTVFRSGWEDTKDFEIKRDTIIVKSVKYEIKDSIGYIEINQFGDDTLTLTKEALKKFQDNGINKIILDLRNNPGGYLQDAIDITSMFLDSGLVVVKEKDKFGNESSFKTTLNKKFDGKMVVLVNGGSASASEILSGALQDHKRAEVIGEKTFGKGSVQSIEDLSNGSKIRITIARWLTPNGREIDKEGIDPTIEVKISKEDEENNNDKQLDKAIEILK